MKSSMIDSHDSRQTDASDCVAYFDEMSTLWDSLYAPNGSMKWRLAAIRRQLQTYVPRGGRILDFGCGTGDISSHCASAGYNVDGIDFSTKMVARARARFRKESIRFQECSNTLKLPFPDALYDGIICSSVLEYVVPLQAQLRELGRVCKDGGRAIMTVPDLAHPLRWLEGLERLLVVTFRNILPHAYQARLEYLALSINRFPLRIWAKQLQEAGWKVLASERSNRPLLIVVAEKRAVATGAAPVV